MIGESSRISTLLNAVNADITVKPSTERFYSKKSTQLNKSIDKKQKTGDELNEWTYCKPDILEDKLPQPYRLINKLIYKVILNEVNQRIEEIEKAKKSYNYEGGTKEIAPSSFFDLDGISCYAKDPINPYNTLLAGDKFGNILLFDLNKRVLVTKSEIAPEKRILHISSVTIPYGETHLTTFAVIIRGDPIIQIYRYKANENKFVNTFSIKLAKNIQKLDDKTDISDFAYETQISQEGKFIAVLLYSGNIEIYVIPEPASPIIHDNDPNKLGVKSYANIPISGAKQTLNFQSPGAQGSASKPLEKMLPLAGSPSTVSNDSTIKELQIYKKILLKAPETKKDYMDLLTKMLIDDPNKNSQNANQNPKDAKDPKKGVPLANAGKGPGNNQATNQQTEAPLTISDFEKNDPVYYSESLKSSNNADISPEIPLPKYRGFVFFIHSKFTYTPDGPKSLTREVSSNITTHIVCAWRHNYLVEVYELQEKCKQNIPKDFSYNSLQDQMQQLIGINQGQLGNQPDLKSQLGGDNKGNAKNDNNATSQKDNDLVLKAQYTYTVLYPISMANINKSATYIAIGMKEGSIVVWDLLLNIEKYQLDKHKKEVTCISFYEDWKLITGANDGTVNLYDLKDLKMTKKYQQVFKMENNTIEAIEVTEHGIAFAIDIHGNSRMYDLHHFEKIFKINPQTQFNKKIVFVTKPRPILAAGKEQVCVLGQIEEQSSDDSVPVVKRECWNEVTHTLIFRIIDNLINYFPGLGNIYRRGLEKGKLINAYTKLTMEDLRNPNYEIPNFDNKQDDIHLDSAQKNKFSQSSKHSLGGNQKAFSHSTSKTKSSISSSDINATYIDNFGKNPRPAGPKYDSQLTHANLHPEKFLTEKNKLPPPVLVDPLKKTMESLRTRNLDKNLRAENLQNEQMKIKDQLALEEEKASLLKQRDYLAGKTSFGKSTNAKSTIKP